MPIVPEVFRFIHCGCMMEISIRRTQRDVTFV